MYTIHLFTRKNTGYLRLYILDVIFLGEWPMAGNFLIVSVYIGEKRQVYNRALLNKITR